MGTRVGVNKGVYVSTAVVDGWSSDVPGSVLSGRAATKEDAVTAGPAPPCVAALAAPALNMAAATAAMLCSGAGFIVLCSACGVCLLAARCIRRCGFFSVGGGSACVRVRCATRATPETGIAYAQPSGVV